MRNIPSHCVTLAIVLACTPGWALVPLDDAANAAEPPAPMQRREVIAMATPLAADMTGDTTAFAGADLGTERRVSGAPYCADAINENIQPLADGNRIVHKTTTRLCRDSEGRTRQETEVNGKTRIYINDPVAKRQWTLDPQDKTATPRRTLNINFSSNVTRDLTDSSEWRDYAQHMRDWARQFSDRMRMQFSDDGKLPAPPAPPAPAASAAPAAKPSPVVITETRTETRGAGEGQPQREVRIYRMPATPQGAASATRSRELVTRYRLPAEPGAIAFPPDLPPMPALPANIHIGSGTLQVWAPRGQGVTTSLGQREMEGVKANGERTTWTIEAGKVGNEKPIIITREKWSSPDLMLTLSTRDSDPRSGEVSYRLANLKRGEPDATLFKVPADYKVQESKVRMMEVTPPAPKAQ